MSKSFEFDLEKYVCPPPRRRTVLVTGAAGSIGMYFAQHSHEKYDLTLLVHTQESIPPAEPYGRVEVGDVGDLDRLKTLFKGMDTIVHLAAEASPSQTWGPLLETNIIGTYNVFVAAQAAGCRRVLFASSIHAVSGYSQDHQVQADDPISPGNLYGVTKCFGEAMGRFMATQQGLTTICLRIGGFQTREEARQPASLPIMDAFVSPSDLNQLIHRCIDDERLKFAIFAGLSNNRFNRMNIAEARELVGYRPEDDFTEEHPALKELNLSQEVQPHSEQRGQPSGIREELPSRTPLASAA